MVCEKLWLSLLVDCDDMSFHWKYEELQSGEAYDYVDDGNGYLDHQKFIKWWFMDLKEFFHKNDPVPEEEAPEGEGEPAAAE